MGLLQAGRALARKLLARPLARPLANTVSSGSFQSGVPLTASNVQNMWNEPRADETFSRVSTQAVISASVRASDLSPHPLRSTEYPSLKGSDSFSQQLLRSDKPSTFFAEHISRSPLLSSHGSANHNLQILQLHHPSFSFGHSVRHYATKTPTNDKEATEAEWEELDDDDEASLARDRTGTSDSGDELYETLLVESFDQGRVGMITINRPKKLNALSLQVMDELGDALETFDSDPDIKAIILTGAGEEAFAAGADIKELKDETFLSAYNQRLLAGFEKAFANCRKPVIAAVNGYALGGGCELALMCDIILASSDATFGQPETTLGVIPGMGGTQRLIRAVGKSRAMEMILTGGAFLKAKEALELGLISRLCYRGQIGLLREAIRVAREIAKNSAPVVAMAKEAVNSAYEMGLSEGVKKESLLFNACYGLKDQKIGMTAFLEKKKARFEDQ